MKLLISIIGGLAIVAAIVLMCVFFPIVTGIAVIAGSVFAFALHVRMWIGD